MTTIHHEPPGLEPMPPIPSDPNVLRYYQAPIAPLPTIACPPAPEPIPIGALVWYALQVKTGEHGFCEWCPAQVVDEMVDVDGKRMRLHPPFVAGHVHLAVQIDPRRHSAGSAIAYRMNVREGTGPRQFQREKPAGADAKLAADWAEDALRYKINHERQFQPARKVGA